MWVCQAKERPEHATRGPVEAGQAEDGVSSCRRSANPNGKTERQPSGPQRTSGNGLFRGYSKNRDKRALKIVLDACDIISAERTFRIRPQRPAKPNEHDESRAGVQFALPLAVVFLGWSTCCKRGAPSEWQPCEAQISKEQKAGRAAEVTPRQRPSKAHYRTTQPRHAPQSVL